MPRLFVSQELLDQWTEQGKIELSGNSLKILAEERSFQLRPAARFLSLAAGSDDGGLVGKVKGEEQLRTLGAELYMNSALLGESAYDVQSGFLTELSGEVALGKPLDGPTVVARPPTEAEAAGPKQAREEDGFAGRRAEAAGPKQATEARPTPRASVGGLEEEKAMLAKFLLDNLT